MKNYKKGIAPIIIALNRDTALKKEIVKIKEEGK